VYLTDSIYTLSDLKSHSMNHKDHGNDWGFGLLESYEKTIRSGLPFYFFSKQQMTTVFLILSCLVTAHLEKIKQSYSYGLA